jgi:hypothetical protein
MIARNKPTEEPSAQARCPITYMPGRRLALVAFSLLIAAPHAYACRCGGIRGRTAWEIAEKAAQGSQVIFEGSLIRSAVEWDILGAKDGDLVRPRQGSDSEGLHPRMVITFRVKTLYKGDNVGSEVQVRTGLGGGDCGSQFVTGLDYLVYAYASPADPNLLRVSQCGPGDWMGSSSIATHLRYLRKQTPLKNDLALLKHSAMILESSEWQENARRYTAATGQICGVVNPGAGAASEGGGGVVEFLSTSGYSPYPPSVSLETGGKFCSDRLGPGEYYLHVTQWSSERRTAGYFPGVAEREKATILKIGAGQVLSNLRFTLPEQKTYTIHGFLSIDDKSGMEQSGGVPTVFLISSDGRIWDRQEIDLQQTLPLTKIKYFSFKNVAPGRYVAFALPLSSHGYTRIAHVQVTSHGKLIFLALKNQNASKNN